MPDHDFEARDAAYWTTVPAAVTDYLNLDLGANGETAQALFAGLEQEVSHPAATVHLQEEKSDRTSGLTPHMGAWYQFSVVPFRAAALDAVRTRFAEDRIRGVPTILFEEKRDQVQHETAARANRAMSEFRAKHQGTIKDRDDAQHAYETAKVRHGQRHPVVTNKPIYITILTLLAVLEFFMNFKTMMASPLAYGVPALALALTVGAALFIGVASHIDGTHVKQWQYWMHGMEPDRKRRCTTMLTLSATLLAAGLGAIGFGRFIYAKSIINNAILLGNPVPSIVGLMTGTMIGNIGVWLVGAYIAYSMHDADPDYPQLKLKADRLRNTIDRDYAAVTAEIKELNEKCRTDINILQTQSESQHSSPAFGHNRTLFEKVAAKDRMLTGLIKKYREEFRRKYPEVRFYVVDSDLSDPSGRKTITAAEWAASDLTLHYNRGVGA